MVTRTERGWAGHFIAAPRCMFRRNTLLEFNDIKIVVSTVGQMIVDGIVEEIGCDRYYETMAFHSDIQDSYYHDADVTKEISFDSDWALSYCNYQSDKAANDIHENVVNEITTRLMAGDKFEVGR